MSATYEELLTETIPVRIATEIDYDRITARFGALLIARKLTTAEKRLMELLGVLIEDYDRRHGLPPDDSTPAELLQFLLDHSGKKATDLLPVFGQRSHVYEALTGKRPISADQARKLGAIFHVRPGIFV